MSRQVKQNLTNEELTEYRKQFDDFLKHQNLDYGEIIVNVDLIKETILTLEHARKFVKSKFISMHPDGVELYDECLDKLKSFIN
jgi:hypothetical protein